MSLVSMIVEISIIVAVWTGCFAVLVVRFAAQYDLGILELLGALYKNEGLPLAASLMSATISGFRINAKLYAGVSSPELGNPYLSWIGFALVLSTYILTAQNQVKYSYVGNDLIDSFILYFGGFAVITAVAGFLPLPRKR